MSETRPRRLWWLAGGAFTLLLAVGFILPVVARSRQRHPPRSSIVMNVIGKALMMYSEENDGRLPHAESPESSLASLYPRYISNAADLINPREPADYWARVDEMKEPAKTAIPPELVKNIGYAIEPSATMTEPTSILAYEKQAISGGRVVCHASGVVEYMDESDFQQALAKQREKSAPPPNSSTP